MMSKNNLDSDIYRNVVQNKYDFGTGSWAVVNPRITMKLDVYGEYHPYISSGGNMFTVEEAKLLKETCLSTSKKNESDVAEELFSKVPNIRYEKRIGYYLGLYVGHVLQGNYRKNGSSGGFGTWIVAELYNRHLIDGVIHVKKSESDNVIFEYGISKSISDIRSGSGTKYYPVEYSKVIEFVKKNPGKYAIVGLPSYIMELRLLSNVIPELRSSLKYMIGLVCGHQKSTKFAEFLAWQCGIRPGNLKSIDFRKKMSDSPASDYAIEVTGTIDGKEKKIVKRMKDLVGGDWGEGIFKVRASDFTDDVMNETADVTLGDAWLPEYTNDSKGNNIIVVRNPVIQSIIKEGISNHLVKVDRVGVNTIVQSQNSHYHHTITDLPYRLLKQRKRHVWYPQKRVEESENISWTRRKIQDQRERICLKVPEMYRDAVLQNDIDIFLEKLNGLFKRYDHLYLIQRIVNKLKRIFS